MVKFGQLGIGKIFIGQNEIAKAYLGQQLVYSKAVADPFANKMWRYTDSTGQTDFTLALRRVPDYYLNTNVSYTSRQGAVSHTELIAFDLISYWGVYYRRLSWDGTQWHYAEFHYSNVQDINTSRQGFYTNSVENMCSSSEYIGHWNPVGDTTSTLISCYNDPTKAYLIKVDYSESYDPTEVEVEDPMPYGPFSANAKYTWAYMQTDHTLVPVSLLLHNKTVKYSTYDRSTLTRTYASMTLSEKCAFDGVSNLSLREMYYWRFSWTGTQWLAFFSKSISTSYNLNAVRKALYDGDITAATVAPGDQRWVLQLYNVTPLNTLNASTLQTYRNGYEPTAQDIFTLTNS